MRTLAVVIGLSCPLIVFAQIREKVVPKVYHHTFSAKHPVIGRVMPSDHLRTEILDAGGLDHLGEQRASPSNPLSGPFYIDGAEPGDTVMLKIRVLKMTRKWGWSNYRLGAFALTPEYFKSVFSDRYKPDLVRPGRDNLVPWDIDLEKMTVRIREPQPSWIDLSYPARPMLGCIGVAAEGDAAPSSTISGPWGGNINYNELVQGAVLYLPVYHPGALVFVGDGHALQGDGETLGTGIETPMEVEVQVGVFKKHPGMPPLSGPRMENKDFFITIGSQTEFVSSLDKAFRMATVQMVEWLGERQVEPWVAHQIIGMMGKYDIVTAAGSVALRIPRSVIERPR